MVILSARALVLLVLQRGGETFGAEVSARIARYSAGALRGTHGVLYPTFDALVDEGLLTRRVARERAPDERRGGRPRHYYALTPAGHAEASKVRAALAALLGTS